MKTNKEDWEAEFNKLFNDMQSADAPDVQTIIKDFIKPLLSTQEEKFRELVGKSEIHDTTECKDENCIVNQRIIGKNMLRKELLNNL